MSIDKIIGKEFSSSFMNDSKWSKLMETLTNCMDEIFVDFKQIGCDDSQSTSFYSSDFKPFFKEPILYKEIEWVEFPRLVNEAKNKRVSRKYLKSVEQDIDKFEKVIKSIGEFVIEKSDNSIRIIAYR